MAHAKSENYEAIPVSAVAQIAGKSYFVSKYDISTNCHGATDISSFTMPISSNVDFSTLYAPSEKSDSTDKPIYVKILAGFPPTSANNGMRPSLAGLLLRFSGVLDQYSAQFEGDAVTFQARSLAAPLTTERIQAPFAGSSITTVQFVAAMAKKYNLGVNIFPGIKPLTMQSVLANELQAGVHTYPIWDLILQAAVQDDVDVWVDAYGVLWYYPSDQIPRTNVSLVWLRDLAQLSMTHGLQFMRNVEVRVHSYLTKTKYASSSRAFSVDGITIQTEATTRLVKSTPIWGTNSSVSSSTNAQGVTTTTASTTSGGKTEGTLSAPGNYSGKQIYDFWVKGKGNDQCKDLAKKFYRQILLHEYQVSMRVPVTRKLFSQKNTAAKSPASVSKVGIQCAITLSNSPYAKINTSLWPRQIREQLSPTEGFYWEIDANVNRPAQGGV